MIKSEQTAALPLNRIVQGNALEVILSFPDESIDMIMTSPPYWGLRCYETSPQIWDDDTGCVHEWGQSDFGLSPLPNEPLQSTPDTGGSFCVHCDAWRGELGAEPFFMLYIQHLCQIFDQAKRVLKASGTCWVNLGDTYASRGNLQSRWAADGKLSKAYMGRGRTEEVPAKSLCQIPSRFAIEMTNRGWTLRNEIIWWKPNCLPASVKDRFTVDFEKLFFFTKSQNYYFAQQLEPPLDLKRLQHRLINPENVRKREYGDRFIGSLNPKTAEASRLRILAQGRNKRSVWRVSPRAFRDAHFAVYPPELVEVRIKAGCPVRGVVLDPFVAAGQLC